MNIVEAFKIAKEQGKRVRPVGVNWYLAYNKDLNLFIKVYRSKTSINCWNVEIKDVLKDWEVAKENKQTQYKIDSIKFQIVRYCRSKYLCKGCKMNEKCSCIVNSSPYKHLPKNNMLNDWSLKEIIEAYHILKNAKEI